MASIHPDAAPSTPVLHGRLSDSNNAIGDARFDAILLWGAPLIAFLLVWLWVDIAGQLPAPMGDRAIAALFAGVAILTFAHLIAVAPRAYLNAEVFGAYRRRLTLVPLLLIAALLLSPTLLVCAGVLAVFWDVHHSAMQTFGLSRIYDMKAGNGAHELRKTDLRLYWALYVGPIAAGASLLAHVERFGDFGQLDWRTLTALPGVVESHASGIRIAAIAAWLAIVLWAVRDYRAAIRRGYRLPIHKAALLGSTATVSIAAWGLAPPVIAFAAINLFHAAQYFALVWLKEGGRMRSGLARLPKRTADASADPVAAWVALAVFLVLCAGFGIAYFQAQEAKYLLAPFIACSLLHFWYDGFVWSVRKKQV